MSEKEQKKQYWFVIRQLTQKEIKRKYSRSKLGVLWSILNPLLHMIVMSAIFSTIFKHNIDNYPIYFLGGHIVWDFYTASTRSVMTSLTDNSTMLIKMKLPMNTFPQSKTFSALVNLGFSLIPFIGVMIFFRVSVNFSVLFVIPVIFLLYFFTLGIGYILAVAYVFFADIKYLYTIFTTLLMYCSALFYPVSRLTGAMSHIVNLNPVYEFIYSVRCCILYGRMPEFKWIMYIVLWTVVAYVAGKTIFEKNRNKIMQKI